MASPKMLEFFKVWLEWATQPKVEDTREFYRDCGLCTCLTNYYPGQVELHTELISMLEVDFKGNYQFPFEGKLAQYWDSKKKQTLHKNPKRVEWVRKQLSK